MLDLYWDQAKDNYVIINFYMLGLFWDQANANHIITDYYILGLLGHRPS